MTNEQKQQRIRESNFRAALASFIREHLPVADPYTDDMNDVAWEIAQRLEGRFWSEFQKVADGQPVLATPER